MKRNRILFPLILIGILICSLVFSAYAVTEREEEALKKAQQYLSNSGFSYEGLIHQLEFNKFSHEEAVFAADNCDADWFECAVTKAKSYISNSGFSYEGLIHQLEYEKFTHEQAVFGADNCDADWFECAVTKAKSYLYTMDFSYGKLIHQLEFDKFTHEQAVYAADIVFEREPSEGDELATVEPTQEPITETATEMSTDETKETVDDSYMEDVGKYTELAKGSKGEEVKALQTRLKELGFYSISIDGDYGNGTVNAIKAFEDFNELEQTGIATPELQAFLYSEYAKGIEIPDIEISKVNINWHSKSYPYVQASFKNNTDNTIDAMTIMVKAYDTYGERILRNEVLTIQSLINYGTYNFVEKSSAEIINISIKPGKTLTLSKKQEIDTNSMFGSKLLNSVEIAVVRYHTTDGQAVNIPENEQIWYGSNGNIYKCEYVINEQDLNEIQQGTNTLWPMNISYSYIPSFDADAVGLPTRGVYVKKVDNNYFDIKVGDFIVKINGIWVYDEESWDIATSTFKDDGTRIPVEYYRDGELKFTEMYL